MPPSDRDFDGGAGHALAADIIQSERGEWKALWRGSQGRRNGFASFQVSNDVFQVVETESPGSGNEGGFDCRLAGGDDFLNPGSVRGQGGEKGAVGWRTQASLQVDLCQKEAGDFRGAELADSPEKGGGKGKVEREASLADLGRNQIEEDLAVGPIQSQPAEGGREPLGGFPGHSVGTSDQNGPAQTPAQQGFHPDQAGPVPLKSGAVISRYHSRKTLQSRPGYGAINKFPSRVEAKGIPLERRRAAAGRGRSPLPQETQLLFGRKWSRSSPKPSVVNP